MDYVAMGRCIRNRRKEMHMTQAALSEKVDVSTSFIGHIERGSRKASLDTLIKIANVMQTGVDRFIADSLTEGVIVAELTEEEKRLALDVLELIRKHRNNE